jgi:hypothetical protein
MRSPRRHIAVKAKYIKMIPYVVWRRSLSLVAVWCET